MVPCLSLSKAVEHSKCFLTQESNPGAVHRHLYGWRRFLHCTKPRRLVRRSWVLLVRQHVSSLFVAAKPTCQRTVGGFICYFEVIILNWDKRWRSNWPCLLKLTFVFMWDGGIHIGLTRFPHSNGIHWSWPDFFPLGWDLSLKVFLFNPFLSITFFKKIYLTRHKRLLQEALKWNTSPNQLQEEHHLPCHDPWSVGYDAEKNKCKTY